MSRTHSHAFEKDKDPKQAGHSKKADEGMAASQENEILALQKTAGNQAVRQSLEHKGGEAARDSSGVPEHVRDVVRTPGQPLDPAIRAEMEGRFGEDFGDVRVHTDADAKASAHEVKAKAYTVGKDVAFGEGHYAPDTREGKKLLAHELVHVVQQRRGGATPAQSADSAHEQEAAAVSKAIGAGGQAVNVRGATGVGLARAPDEQLEAASAEDLWRLIQGLRGFSATDPPHTVEAAQAKVDRLKKQLSADPKNKALKTELEKARRQLQRTQKRAVKIDPKGVGKPIGQGYSTYAAIQIVDQNGKQVATAIGEYGSKGHAEEQAIKQLRSALAGKKITNGRLVVVVDQVVCGKCRKLLQDFAKEAGLKRVEAHYPTRPPLGKKTGKVSPKTAARTSVQAGRKTSLKKDVIYQEGREPSKPPDGKPRPPSKTPKAGGKRAAPKKRTGDKGTAAQARGRIITKYAKNTDFKTKGRVKYTDRTGASLPRPRAQIRGTRSTRFRARGAGIAELLPSAINVLQDRLIRHRVAVDMLRQWSQLEKWRRNHPNDVIIAVVSLQEWEHPDPAGQVARAVNYVDFFHGPTVADAEAKAANVLRSGVPKGWREVGPFIGVIQPTDDLNKVKAHVEGQECFIATACYGSPLAPEVMLLRAYRDAVLCRGGLGRAFIKLYYAISPPLASFLQQHSRVRRTVRKIILTPIVALVRRSAKHWSEST